MADEKVSGLGHQLFPGRGDSTGRVECVSPDRLISRQSAGPDALRFAALESHADLHRIT